MSLPEEQREAARELNRALDRAQLTLHEFSHAIHELTGRTPERVEHTIITDSSRNKNRELLNYITQKRSSYKIGLLSNIATNWIHDSFLTAEEAAIFDAYILSFEVGMTKPDPRIYQMAAEKLGVQPEECIFIDDGEANCQGAVAIGMQAVLYHDFSQAKNEIEKLLRS